MPGDDEVLEVVASVGPLDATVVALREFLHRSGAIRAVAVLDGAMVDCPRLAPVAVTVGERTVHLPHAIELEAEPAAVPEVRQLPPFDVNAQTGEITGTIGGVEHLAGAVRELARMLGDRSVALAQFETTTPDVPLSISARGDDPLVVAIGDEEYEMEPGWP
jgi:hypothetical protein